MAKEIHATLLMLRRGPLEPRWDPVALGQSDPALPSAARAAEKKVLGLLARYRPVRVLSSDLKRARSTAEKLAARANASFAARRDLRERRFGTWQGRPWPEIIEQDPDRAVPFLQGFCTARPPRGETLETVGTRVVKAIAAECRRHQRETLCYVGHAGPIRCLIAHALALPLAAVQRLQLDPFSLTILRYEGAAATLSLLNHSADGTLPGGLAV